MDYPLRTLIAGYGPPGEDHDPAMVTVCMDAQAWETLRNREPALNRTPGLPTPDWSQEVLLWLRPGGTGDSSQELEVAGLTRETAVARISAHLAFRPAHQDLDFLTSPWTLAAAAREAFTDAESIHYEVDGHPGEVEVLP